MIDAQIFMEKTFGKSGIDGLIWANPLPDDYQPTPELENIILSLKNASFTFIEFSVKLSPPDGYRYATYEGSGHYLDQYVRKHSDFEFYQSKFMHGDNITIVLSKKGERPEYGMDNLIIRGTPHEYYDRFREPMGPITHVWQISPVLNGHRSDKFPVREYLGTMDEVWEEFQEEIDALGETSEFSNSRWFRDLKETARTEGRVTFRSKTVTGMQVELRRI